MDHDMDRKDEDHDKNQVAEAEKDLEEKEDEDLENDLDEKEMVLMDHLKDHLLRVSENSFPHEPF